MILSQEAQSPFSNENLRGVPLSTNSFEARCINCVAKGTAIEAFVVSPVDYLTGYGYDNAIPKASYTTFGVYAVDQDTLTQWKKSNLTSALKSAFNNETSGITNIFMTRNEALERAEKINETVYESYLKDFQNGKIAGITNWRNTLGTARPETTKKLDRREHNFSAAVA